MVRRRFNKSEHSAFYRASDGNCELCGKQLSIGWHADHIHPHSRSGKTVLENGQALCPDCNLKKGNKVSMRLPAWPKDIELRRCQTQAYTTYIDKAKPNFLADLTPGAGKTILGMRVAHSGLIDGRYKQIIVACPTKLLKVQWMNKFALVGIQINPYYESGNLLASGYHGAAVTYSQVAADPKLLRVICNKHDTLVILDEPHHCGVPKTWGDSVEFAFENAVARLLITGTAWRSDNCKIPFVDYPDGIGRADYTYGYKDAIRDGVCRYVVFPTYEGTMEWIHGITGDILKSKFEAELNERQSTERLKTALSPTGEFMKRLIKDAHEKLMECRLRGHPNAGGLLVCTDIQHAQELAKTLTRLTGCIPMVVTSDTEAADEKIESFSASTQEWIIAVKMVSEGVDIPRLRVGVYATNVTTQLFFTQFVGRFVRWIPGLPEQTAYVYIPEDPRIAACAYNIAQEGKHAIDEAVEEDAEEDDEFVNPDTGERESFFRAISSIGEHNGAIVDTDKISPEELDSVRGIAESVGQSPEMIARIKRLLQQDSGATSPPSENKTPSPAYREAEDLKNILKKLIPHYARLIGCTPKEVNREWMYRGGKAHKVSDVSDLTAKVGWLRDLIDQESKRRGKSAV